MPKVSSDMIRLPGSDGYDIRDGMSYKELVRHSLTTLQGTVSEEALLRYMAKDKEISHYYRLNAAYSTEMFELIQRYRDTMWRLLRAVPAIPPADPNRRHAIMDRLALKMDAITDTADRLYKSTREKVEEELRQSVGVDKATFDAVFGRDDALDAFDFDDAYDSTFNDDFNDIALPNLEDLDRRKKMLRRSYQVRTGEAVIYTTGNLSDSEGGGEEQQVGIEDASGDAGSFGNIQEDVKTASRRKQKNVLKKTQSAFWSTFKSPFTIFVILLMMLIVIFVRPYLIPSGSMIPTLLEGDRIISIARYFSDGHSFQPGDIVCFTAPSGETYIKRIVACGGDTVTISGDTLYVNGEESPYQGAGTGNVPGTWTLADDEYFMMGDNRGNSQDSRYIGPIKADKIISQALIIYAPFDRACVLE